MSLDDVCSALGPDLGGIIALYVLGFCTTFRLWQQQQPCTWPEAPVRWLSHCSRHCAMDDSTCKTVELVWSKLLKETPTSCAATDWRCLTHADPVDPEDRQCHWATALGVAIRWKASNLCAWLVGSGKSREMACAALYQGNPPVVHWLATTGVVGPKDVSLLGDSKPSTVFVLARFWHYIYYGNGADVAKPSGQALSRLQETMDHLAIDLDSLHAASSGWVLPAIRIVQGWLRQ